MAGEVSANICRSRKHNTEREPPDRNKSPNFITDETEFVGKGDIRTSTPINKHRRSRSKSGTRKTPVPLSFSDEHFIEDLEAYVREMSATRQSTGTMDAGQEQDLWAQLQQKESDLLLAAELGKALLDKNEELKKEQERVMEEYSKKVEVSQSISLFVTDSSTRRALIFLRSLNITYIPQSIFNFNSVLIRFNYVFVVSVLFFRKTGRCAVVEIVQFQLFVYVLSFTDVFDVGISHRVKRIF